MKTYMLNDSHKIEVQKENENSYIVSFYEFYASCGKWFLIGSPEIYSKDAIEYEYDIEI